MEQLEQLILERNNYELMLYDYLLFVPDDFWEPVKIKLDYIKLNKLVTNDCLETCIICCFDKNKFVEMKCCKNSICTNCTDYWFNESVRCPFCRQDLREILI